MKYPSSVILCSLAATMIFAAVSAKGGVGEAPPPVDPPLVGDNAPLFPTGFRYTVFAETANGNVDSNPNQTTTYTTTTHVVGAPTTPAATPTPSPSQTPDNEVIFKSTSKTFTKNGKIYRRTTTRRITSSDHILHNALGGGVQGGYFFNEYFGVSLESDFLGSYDYNTAVTANLIFRYPFEFGQTTSGDAKDGKSTVSGPTWGLAPYALIGGGGQWDGRAEGIGDIGGGLELALPHDYGFFLEGRWIIHDARQSYAAETAGVTFGF